jgi:enterochelin esterase-like enzyme
MGMKRFTVILSLLVLLMAGLVSCKHDNPPDVQPFTRLLKSQTYQSSILHRTMNYAVLLPEEYENSTDSFPVVYLLHGFGDDETAWYAYGLIKYYVDLYAAQNVPMIYVMPDAFNTYYVNKYNGNYPFMDVIITELVPAIDSNFRTIKDANHRAVMGYSMGGYGAIILPAKNPDVFKTGVALSMSFRTDDQYMAESQGSFDSQWGPIFGAIGATGTGRLTDYFKEHSPFHFFENQVSPSLNGLNFYIDCGDDEETLSETSGELHNLLRDLDYPHEYRMDNGGHDWNYWHRELPEALSYISYAVQQITYPTEPEPVDPGPPVPADRIKPGRLNGQGVAFTMVLPASYSSGTSSYPLIIVNHQRQLNAQEQESQELFSLLNKNMVENKIPESLVLEIPLIMNQVNKDTLQQILDQVRAEYRISEGSNHTILMGNQEGGAEALYLAEGFSGSVNACLLFDAPLLENAPVMVDPAIVYYLDQTDKGTYYKGYHAYYVYMREQQVSNEYRVRRGTPSHDSFLAGLDKASGFIKDHLK